MQRHLGRHLCALLLAGAGCSAPEVSSPEAKAPAVGVSEGADLLTDAARAVGIDFVHFNGMTGQLTFVENMGAGVAAFDFDGDGDQDLFFVQGWVLARETPPSLTLIDRLYRNDGVGEDGLPRFTDVSRESGIRESDYGMGVATGDFDADGHVDLYVTNFGPNRLWRNLGDGTFEDVTARAGVDDPRWSTAATFFDFDRDGLLDLFAGTYVDFRLEEHQPCRSESGLADYCSPENYPPLVDRLWRNLGDGTFEDVTTKAGLGALKGKALGVIAADFDDDGWQDLYVANDQIPNFLWINQGDGTFREEGLAAGAAVNREGRPEASMGVDAADFDDDGDEDLFVSHLRWESNTLYVNSGGAAFRDRSFESGLGSASLGLTGFGTRFFDADNDGRLDLLVVNGDVKIIEEQRRRGEKHPLRQRDQLFLLGEDGLYREAAAAGAALEVETVSRGAAFADLDNDGDTDIVVAQNHGAARVLLNQSGQDRSWIGLRLVSRDGRQDMLGARVTVGLAGGPAGGRILGRRCHCDGSYLSASDPRVLVGLGDAPAVEWTRVHWPDGSVEQWLGLAPKSYHTLRQGEGRTWSE